MFFSFDGIDGSGKTTQIELFCDWLRETGHNVAICRDPGSTELGEMLRDIVLGAHKEVAIGQRSEMLLYMAARAQLVDEIIRPALDEGKTVVSDRYLLANIVYQGYAGGLDIDEVRGVGQVATAGIGPDCVFLLDVDPLLAAKRLQRNLDRMEKRGDEYRQKLREGFLAEAAQSAGRIQVIDSTRPPDVIQADIRCLAATFLENRDIGK
jgi:dTMP kinase